MWEYREPGRPSERRTLGWPCAVTDSRASIPNHQWFGPSGPNSPETPGAISETRLSADLLNQTLQGGAFSPLQEAPGDSYPAAE